MSAKFSNGHRRNWHQTVMDDRERERALTTERNFHHLQWHKGSPNGFCSCGYFHRDVSTRDVYARQAMHVEEVMRVFTARLNGVEP